jgi:hypothetical protein
MFIALKKQNEEPFTATLLQDNPLPHIQTRDWSSKQVVPNCVEVHEATRNIFLHASEVKYELASEEITT